MIFVSSWDDGHPLDERLADLLARYGLKGTFYVPLRNREGRDVMSTTQLRTLDAKFEVGSHTLDHVYLPELSNAGCVMQIRDGKQGLEDMLGHAVPGFCYPGGKVSGRIRRAVMEAGFEHARTVSNLWLSAGHDRFLVPTTAQFYPHRRELLWRNFIRGGHYLSRARGLLRLATGVNRLDALHKLATYVADADQVFHIWGHSWEIDKCELWLELDAFLAYIASLQPVCMTVSELASWQRGGVSAMGGS